jgi:type IV secretion system protein VirB2
MNSPALRAARELACTRARVRRAPCRARTLRTPQRAAAAAALQVMPVLAVAQSSPFMTGASALQTNILAWLTPIAVILVMVLGAMAMANRMSWGWCIGAILGIAIAFGAPQIVTWVRGMFGV